MKRQFKILEISACSNKQAAKKLKFVGNAEERIIILLQKVLQ